MIDWSFPPEIQAQYDRVCNQIRRLQIELDIEPMTLEQRAEAYRKHINEEARKQEELKKMLGTRRPIPKWKV